MILSPHQQRSFRGEYFKKKKINESMSRLKAALTIQLYYRHWKWALAVKKTIEMVGMCHKWLWRQSGRWSLYNDHLKYLPSVMGTPSWCCPNKNYGALCMTRNDMLDYLIQRYVYEIGINPEQYKYVRRSVSARKIQRLWRNYTIYDPKSPAINIQRWWRKNKIKRGSYFKMIPKAIGNRLSHYTYIHQDNIVWLVTKPLAKCCLLKQQLIPYPIDQSNNIVRIVF